MAPVDPDKLRHHLDYARRNLERLRRVRDDGEEAFLGDDMTQAATIRLLQVAIEALLDCGHHVIAREGLGIPRQYADTVRLLVEAGILPGDHQESLLRMVRFRNRAVHLYDEIDAPEVFDILEHHLGDLELFIAAIAKRYLAPPPG
jgi:uncharacterized protein YutE (UPF0331/DUF86 family)